ncbi:MAG: hypothetical protein CR980_00775 [Propionibacteriales bacterium]|nr:MAG: hypothetical protein CR980_00775 [Propionibacteriales bacterium]
MVLLSAAVIAMPLATLTVPASADPKIPEPEAKTYIVGLKADPLVTYKGGVRGIPATKPKAGQKAKIKTTAAKKYERHLKSTQDKVLRQAGVKPSAKKAEMTRAFNGFSAKLTAAQVSKIKKSKDVAYVWEDEIRHADTVSTPKFLGMTGWKGVWRTEFGLPQTSGKGVIVGVIDTGIDPNNPSFKKMRFGYEPTGWGGVCDKGEDPEFKCSNKIIGARWYGEEYGNQVIEGEYKSARDRNGHGSHTAGTAAGNHRVRMSIDGTNVGRGSGMAPGAYIAVYKALWETADGNGSGTTSGLVAAIDDAVADGVDVINYSISGSDRYIISADQLAFFAAAEAGIFVSTSAGNDGDTVGKSSVAHNAPWTMTVAASTHDRGAEKTVKLGNNATYKGLGVGPKVGPAPVVYAGDIPAAGASAKQAKECHLDIDESTDGNQIAIDVAKADGKIVVCDRGTIARVDKSAAVKEAGGVGMIHANVDPAQSLNADFHSVPTIHVNSEHGDAIKAYVASDSAPTATISARSTAPAVAPKMAGFSSYGPALAGSGDLLKPDITAPGVDVVAAYHGDPETGKPQFASISGTSMSAPHIAGLAALMKERHPTWSPMAIKSAMMTTARQLDTSGKPIKRGDKNATPHDFGAGHVVPKFMFRPGLVYESNRTDWVKYGCAIDQLQLVGFADECEGVKMDPSDFNGASISIGSLAGKQTVSRTVTNVSNKTKTYVSKVKAPKGVKVQVIPRKLTLGPGQSRTFKVKLERTTAAMDKYAFGSLTWQSGKGIRVRSPIAVRPVAIAAPEEISVTGKNGSEVIEAVSGFSGKLNASASGLVPAQVNDVNVVRDENSVIDGYTSFTVPAGTKTFRIATYDDEVDAADIDLLILDSSFKIVGQSAGSSAEEMVTMHDPAPGKYYVAIDLFSSESSVDVPVNAWILGDAAEGNLTVTPASQSVAIGSKLKVTANWTGLTAGTRYLGSVNYADGSTPIGDTLISVVA